MVNYAERHKKLKYAKLPFSIISTPCEIAKGFGGYLFPDERLDIILTALEALQDSSIHDKQGACSVLDAALEVPYYWLTDVPTIMGCLDSLLLQADLMMSREEVKNLLQFSPPRDSTDLAMWEVILAMPKTLERVLGIMIRDLPLRNWYTAVTEDTCIRRLAMLGRNHIFLEDFGNPVHLQSYLRHPSSEMRLMVLKGLCTVSESPVKVSGPSSSKAMLAAWGFALLPSRPSPLPGSKAGGWCSGTRALCPGWSLTASRKGNGVFPTGKENSGLAARHPGGPASHQHRHGAEGPACAEKRDGSCGEEGGQWPGSAAG
eukprot:XP_027304638.1 uncharacterized protein LOC113842156 [Anas platyrhynchos]